MLSSLFAKPLCMIRSVNTINSRTWSKISEAMAKTLSFTELNEKLKGPKVVLLDVREPAELKTDGKISGAHNVPLGQVPAAFQLANEDFEEKYGFQKPQPADDIVIHCKAGVRAQNAAKVLMGSGYSKVEVYPGILDWVENGGKVDK